MRQSPKQHKRAPHRPLVGIAVDGINAFGRAVMRGTMRYANTQRKWLIYEEMRRMFDRRRQWPKCDGAITAGAEVDLIRHIRDRTRHVIQCSGSADPEETPVVCLDDVAAGAMAAGHLLDCRIEHFAYYGRRLSLTSVNRCKGFAAALGERGYGCEQSPVDWPVESDRSRDSHWPKLIPWLRSLPKPVGILAMDDSAAHDLAAACLKAELSVPDRVALIGINNDDLLCESAWPPLTSVEGDFSRVGFVAAGILDRLLRGESLRRDERLTRLPPLGIVARVSTDVLAVDDPNLAEAVRFVREHACDPCTVHDVLRAVPVGRRWLERQFAAKLGRTPHDEILRVRMDTARRLLLRNDLTLPAVAAHCGFAAVASFTRAFTQSQGVPPGTYRRSVRVSSAE